jgi:hypothetical protein
MCEKEQKVWIVAELLYLMMVEGESDGTFTPVAEAICPVSLETFLSKRGDAKFFSIHPCTT